MGGMQHAPTNKTTGILPPPELEKLIPGSVYFQGQAAPVQIRNAGAVRFGDGSVLFAVLVDNSGYSSGVRERYQFYLVAETAVMIGDQGLSAGAYGAGFLDDGTFLIMDIGGHELMRAQTVEDGAMRRPRPLQMIAGGSPDEVRLYLGRRYAVIRRRAR